MKKIIVIFFVIAAYGFNANAQQASLKTTMERGQKLYETYCLSCHQADGSGVPRLNPPLIQTSYVTGNKKKLVQWVLHGSQEEKVPIDGNTYSNNMPPQNYLKDGQIADILTYIRKSFGNKANAVSASEVKAIRAVTKVD